MRLQTIGMLGPAAFLLLAASPAAAGSVAAGVAFITAGQALGAPGRATTN